MREITLDEIKVAFQETGLKPIRNHFGRRESGNVNCGCVLTALACKSNPTKSFFDIVDDLERENFDSYFGDISNDYADGVVAGFDEFDTEDRSEYRSRSISKDWVAGYKVGFAARNELFEFNETVMRWELKKEG